MKQRDKLTAILKVLLLVEFSLCCLAATDSKTISYSPEQYTNSNSKTIID